MPQFTQADRQARIDTPLGEDVLLLVRVVGEGAISRPFRFHLELQSTARDIDPDEILRKPVVVRWQLRDGSDRFVHGYINRFAQGASDVQLTNYRAARAGAGTESLQKSHCRSQVHARRPHGRQGESGISADVRAA
jgi:uncharacterized protein involved in type VI secretion and phage assembly